MTVQKADAVLEFPDERPPVTKASEVTRAVEQLIGLDYRQFTQIAMIAQGDFLKLLHAETPSGGNGSAGGDFPTDFSYRHLSADPVPVKG